MTSNGSIAADSAYASGLSNHSSTTMKSPLEVDDSSRFVGPGMGIRPGTGSSNQLHSNSTTPSRNSLTGSRDSAQFARSISDEDIHKDWEVRK